MDDPFSQKVEMRELSLIEENKFCKDAGRVRAKQRLWEEAYKSFYMSVVWDEKYEALMRDIDENRYSLKKLRCFITINLEGNGKSKTLLEIVEKLNCKNWISKVQGWSLHNWSDKKNESTHDHVHISIRLSKLYSPSQIVNLLMKDKFIRESINDRKNFIDVKKYCVNDESKIKNYLSKPKWVIDGVGHTYWGKWLG